MLTNPPIRVHRAFETARSALLAERNAAGHWTGELSASPLSTATAVMALEMVRRQVVARVCASDGVASHPAPHQTHVYSLGELRGLIDGGLEWLALHQNADGGWGDTTKSISNISTTMLAHAVFHATNGLERYGAVISRAKVWIEQAGGIEAVRARYGKDKTFSVPILTHCALAGLVDWSEVSPLPFELACLPPQFYKAVRLPVVSYALPALIAIGQVRHHHRPSRNPLVRWVRNRAVRRSLRVLERIQPANGGFLEATPLTSFVTMSLAAMGRIDHPVTQRGVAFLIRSARHDGSWAIDTDLATWVTTLSVNALQDELPSSSHEPLREWLLSQQYRSVHLYTNADPGGWAWTDLPGGVPDADDTPGAILALLHLESLSAQRHSAQKGEAERMNTASASAVRWLLSLQNRDRGWPTFCRGWGTLPFDRSAPDLTAHVLRALIGWLGRSGGDSRDEALRRRAQQAIRGGFDYLEKSQRPDRSWIPLWFGNQYAPDDINPTYGTARVLSAYRDAGCLAAEPARRGLRWLVEAQNDDGGWGGAAGVPSSVEETALAVEVLISAAPDDPCTLRGLNWLLGKVEDGSFREPTPVGFYFAKLWYFEALYPLIFTAAALKRARDTYRAATGSPREFQEQHAARD